MPKALVAGSRSLHRPPPSDCCVHTLQGRGRRLPRFLICLASELSAGPSVRFVCFCHNQPHRSRFYWPVCRPLSVSTARVTHYRLVRPKLHGSSYLVRSTCQCHAAISSTCAVFLPRMSGDVMRSACLPDWLAGGLLRCSAACLSVCRVVLQIPRARHARTTCRGQVASILVRFPRYMLAASSRGCHEDATRKLLQ